jgi:hypothetical protein
MKKESEFDPNGEITQFMLRCGFCEYVNIFTTKGVFIYPNTGIIVDLSASGITHSAIMSHIIKATFEYGQKEKESQIKKVLGL